MAASYCFLSSIVSTHHIATFCETPEGCAPVSGSSSRHFCRVATKACLISSSCTQMATWFLFWISRKSLSCDTASLARVATTSRKSSPPLAELLPLLAPPGGFGLFPFAVVFHDLTIEAAMAGSEVRAEVRASWLRCSEVFVLPATMGLVAAMSLMGSVTAMCLSAFPGLYGGGMPGCECKRHTTLS